MDPIPFVDLKAQNDPLRPELSAALARVLDQGAFALGPEVAAFEAEFAAYCGVAHAVGVNSGTSALQLALAALGVGPGAEVIVPPLSFIATAAAVLYLGARPVFADIDPETYTLDPRACEAAVTPRTRAIVPVHLFGQVARMDELGALASRSGLALVEDACQAHGAESGGRRAGALGAAGCFSFYPTKNLGALGEAGLITTPDAALAKTLRGLRDWGQERKYEHSVLAYNARMDGFQGAVLRAKLPHLEAFTRARRAHAQRYAKLLAGSRVAAPIELPGSRHVYHVFAVRVPERERVREALAAQGIGSMVIYPLPLHLQPALRQLGHARGDFPHAERAARELLALPIYPELPPGAPERVVAALLAALGEP